MLVVDGVGEELLDLKLEDHLFSALRDCLFTIFAITLHISRPSASAT
jgi:hypothetical protein